MPNTRRGRRRAQDKQQGDAEGEIVEVSPSAPVTPRLNVAPTAAAMVEKLKEENRLLKEERDFLREQLKDTLSSKQTVSGAKRKLGARKDDEDYSSDTEDSSTSDLSDSSASSKSRKRKLKRKPKSRKHKGWKEKDDFARRVQTPLEVLQRYKTILRSFQRTKSVSRSCERSNIDRNTIALTAIIAELQIVATPELQIPEFQGGTLQQYAQRCKEYLDSNPNLALKIEEMKKKHSLLPIKYKFRKADN
uniref:Coiled-coil domain containing 106b n=1 Tax=Astyanax mexicanus TaxID=7994 RepID=A0A3B1J4N5_ASTMX